MLNLIRKAVCAVAVMGVALAVKAQDMNGLWHAAPASYAELNGKPVLKPAAYKTVLTDEAVLSAFLKGVQQEYNRAATLALPLPDGGYRTFRIWATPMMEAPLAAKYSDITTYTAEAVGNSQVTAKIDYTPFGFHALVFDGEKSFLIDPYGGSANGAYISYYRSSYTRPDGALMSCETAGISERIGNGIPESLRVHGTVRRQYRLALAADSEYCVAVAGPNPTKAAVLAKMTTTMNRVNGVYEREVAVRMVLIANQDPIIFNTTAPDPYTNNSGSAMLNQNQNTLTALIGSANYDIGHVFSTGGGGIAQQGCVCANNSKGRGVTGSPNPQGDPFDIDYVAHEMGHQFGAGHTFNANTGSCAGNGVSNISYEPGSGSTIMAYAGICTGNNIQGASNDYFHSASLEQITTFLIAGGTCANMSTSTNANAVLTAFSAAYNIPYKTPFELTSPTATDGTADALTYCWEQRNAGGVDFGKSLAATTTDGPLFRSFPPSTSPTRVFPALNRLVTGSSTPGEKLPDVSRSMTFQVTERDVYQGWGAFNFPPDAITLAVTQRAGPFVITSPAGGETFTGGSTQLVTWDVASTDVAPVSCSAVDILMSIDGGFTWPYTLKGGTPNDGSEQVVIANPAGGSSQARIKVKGTGNVFFNINGGDFNIDFTTVGISGNDLDGGISVTPMPASAELRIQAATSLGALSAKLINTLGQEAWKGIVKESLSLNVGGLPRGMYYLQFAGNGQTTVRTVLLR